MRLGVPGPGILDGQLVLRFSPGATVEVGPGPRRPPAPTGTMTEVVEGAEPTITRVENTAPSIHTIAAVPRQSPAPAPSAPPGQAGRDSTRPAITFFQPAWNLLRIPLFETRCRLIC